MRHARPTKSSPTRSGSAQHSAPDEDRSFTIFDMFAWAIVILTSAAFMFVVLAGTDEDVREKELRRRFIDN